ncbi:uncharacterized protein LOC122620235 [Drosophila teissieri]|uniref:uncharacterized protein LOC122620235 n=1 Tax=Drosophila teissieri TaxID=7243 RepID=UPI001CB9EB27|nr:uncharacterized protein LOC122620235 [Drosophila teissieri]
MKLEEVKSLEEIAACAKLQLNEIDLISRTSKCGKSVLEIFDVDEKVSFSSDGGEEEMEILERSVQSDDRPEKMAHEIDCLIRQIEGMQMAIRKRQLKKSSEQVSEESAVQETETLNECQVRCKERENQGNYIEANVNPKHQPLSGNELLEARSLRQAHNRIQQQIDEVICRYRKLREIICEMRKKIRCMEVNLIDLNSKTEKYIVWFGEVAKEMNVCEERYNYLLEAKMCRTEAIKTDQVHTARFLKRNAAYVTKIRLKREIAEFIDEVKDIETLMGELHKELDRNMALFEIPRTNSLDNPAPFLASLAWTVRLSDEFRKSGIKLKDGVN